MYEKRLTHRLTSYWESLKNEDTLPLFQKFNSAAIQDVWDYCMLLAVNDTGGKEVGYSYYKLGDKVRELYSTDVAGQSFNPKHRGAQNSKITQRVGEIVEQKTPLYDEGKFVNERSKIVKFRSCMLPFGQNNSVTHIVVGLSWREFG